LSLTRHALALEYDGRAFCGFQSQPQRCSVQDALEHALGEIGAAPLRVTPAGRTDAGVHATSQIVHFDAPSARPASAWVRGANAHLPEAAAVLWCMPVQDDFHARFRAVARRYTYLLLDRPQRPALLAGRVGWHWAPLDVDAIVRATAFLTGTHDFSSFRAASCQSKSPVKTLRTMTVARRGPLLRFDFEADAFLHHMVRNIVGALVDVGAHKRDSEWIEELLAAADRTRGPATFAPDGLYFRGALYDARWNLPPTTRDLPSFAV
jgi:tRNA pseudouridine38-40 synthase